MIKDFNTCPICGGSVKHPISHTDGMKIYVPCEHCGDYAMTRNFHDDFVQQGTVNKSMIASYLYYHRSHDEYIDESVRIPCICHKQINSDEGFRLVTMEEIRNWYPKTFREKVDLFLLNMDSRTNFLGDLVLFTKEMFYSAFFVDRNPQGPMGTHPSAVKAQAEFFERYLLEQDLVTTAVNGFTLQPKGWVRVDELQKDQAKITKNVFVAMSFAPEMLPIRDAIKDALIECGFVPRIMDEIEHNHQIVPEMLYEIRESRFVIAELTGHNNGAYFEAGYALGYGKEVIQICNKAKFGTDGHFDVKQVNTILWEDTADLTKRLIARIKATIA